MYVSNQTLKRTKFRVKAKLTRRPKIFHSDLKAHWFARLTTPPPRVTSPVSHGVKEKFREFTHPPPPTADIWRKGRLNSSLCAMKTLPPGGSVEANVKRQVVRLAGSFTHRSVRWPSSSRVRNSELGQRTGLGFRIRWKMSRVEYEGNGELAGD